MNIDQEKRESLLKENGFTELSLDVALRANFKCEYCGLDLLSNITTYDLFQIDHIYPQSKNLDDTLENLALSCKLCNTLKRNHFPETTPTSREKAVEYFQDYVAEKRSVKEKALNSVREKVGWPGE